MPKDLRLEDLNLDLDVLDDPALPQETSLVAMTPEEIYAKELEKLEDQIVDLYVHGASVRQLCNRFPRYDEKAIGELITSKLSVRHMNPDHMVGAGIFGFDDDIKALNEFITEEAVKGSMVKLSAIRTRGEIREKKLKYMQSTGLLPDKTNPFDNLAPGSARIEAQETQSRKISLEFNNLSPEERKKKIEEMEEGDIVG